jgi:hypothetical protein
MKRLKWYAHSTGHAAHDKRTMLVSYMLSNRDSSVGIAMGYGIEGRGSILGTDKILFLLHSPPSLLLNGYWNLLLRR